MDILVGTSATIWVDFTSTTGMLIPDENTTVFSLFDHAGQYVLTDQAANPDPGATGVGIFLDPSRHYIAPGRRFEKRQLWVRWRTGGKSYSARETYRIVPLVNYTTSPETVRAYLGLNEDELTDPEVDVFGAFLQVEEEATRAVLDAALASGTRLEKHANDAILAQTVIDLLPGLQNRIIAATTDGPNRFERFRKGPDLADLARDTSALRARAMAALTGAAVTQPTLLVFAEPADPITG